MGSSETTEKRNQDTMTKQEELQLRALVEKQQIELAMQKEELAAKSQVIEEQNDKLAAKDKIIEKQNIQIENMIQALLHARKKLFGRSTESSSQLEGQMHLFETTQELAEALFGEQKKIAIREYTRTTRKPGIRAEMLEGLPKEIVEYIIDPDETCSQCGGELDVIGKKIVRTEVEFIEAKVIVKQIVQQVAKCSDCGTKNSDYPAPHFQKAAIPSTVLPHSIATASLVGRIMYQKIAMGIPFARQEPDYYRMGLVLSRGNMANWVIRCSQEWLQPIYARIHEALLNCEILHMDETRIQCNKEAGKKASSDSWMWVIQSGASEDIKATFFHYARTRGGDVARKLLSGFHGYLTTDAYSGYESVEDIKRNLCWAHVRRYFVESIPLDSNGKEISGSKGAEGREFINLLFKLEQEMSDLTYEEKKAKRQEVSRALLDAFWTWVEETSAMLTTNEKLTKALGYATNQRKYLETFMEDGRLAISNNLCEAHIRPFATARRAWLFADTPKGATANAVLYTLVETARANDLNVYEYLCYLLRVMPDTDYFNHPEQIDAYLPWSKELPEQCRLVQKRQKCLN